MDTVAYTLLLLIRCGGAGRRQVTQPEAASPDWVRAYVSLFESGERVTCFSCLKQEVSTMHLSTL
jgi:hypothetical protein